MAEKTQKIGSASSATLTVNVETGAIVTISKGDVSKQATSKNNAAKFNVTAGVWNALAQKGEQEATGQIEILDEYSLTLSFNKNASDMPVGTKIKIGGKKYSKIGTSYGGVTGSLMLEDELEPLITWKGSSSNSFYSGSLPYQHCLTLKDLLPANEQPCVVQCTVMSENNAVGGVTPLQMYFWDSSARELANAGNTQEGTYYGLTTEQLQMPTGYWTRSKSAGYVYYIEADGTLKTAAGTLQSYQRLTCLLSDTTVLSALPDADGYYTIV